MIMTLDDLEREQQEIRCRSALRVIDVPDNVIYSVSGPLLFQLAHLCCVIDQPMHWRDALRWMWDHKGEILHHAEQLEIKKHEQNNGASSGEADSSNNGIYVEPGGKT